MDSLLAPEPLALPRLRTGSATTSAPVVHHLPCLLLSRSGQRPIVSTALPRLLHGSFSIARRPFPVVASATLMPNSVTSIRSKGKEGIMMTKCGETEEVDAMDSVLWFVLEPNSKCPVCIEPRTGVYTVGEFMTKREDLHVVKPTTTVDEALETLVENRITGFPVIDDDWKLVGLVSDYDLLALDSVSGHGRSDTSMFPEVDSTWKTFNEIQKLLSKTNGKVIGDLMTPAPVVVCESTNLEDAARILLETKYRRLPVVDSEGKLVGIITRGNVVRAALLIKRAMESKA
ncbi:CBS domain [Dillenia turbinata]|uniref:CBS domain n=1 Tax=Dillenia turbinata TaxID=194707 RepID=A0AAN8V494_9MAGN